MEKYDGPRWKELFKPTLDALKDLGGSGTVREIDEKIGEILELSDATIEFPYKNGPSTQLHVQAMSNRSQLKALGYVNNSAKAIWVITHDGQTAQETSNNETLYQEHLNNNRERRKRRKREREKKTIISEEKVLKEEIEKQELEDEIKEEIEEAKHDENWRVTLRNLILALNPYDFEKFTSMILRKCGFIEVEVTKKSQDGGLDGKGILRLNNLVSVPVIFECKKYTNNKITSEQIRSFRGAMEGRADKGLYVTTSSFTRGAWEEATREGAVLIDMIDGERLLDIIREIGQELELISVREVKTYRITVNPEWFKTFQEPDNTLLKY